MTSPLETTSSPPKNISSPESTSKFKVNDIISWNRKKWRVKSINSQYKLYELEQVEKKWEGKTFIFNTIAGPGGYLDISKIDETATLVTSSQKGGLKRSLKNRRSLNKRRSYRRRVKTIRRK